MGWRTVKQPHRNEEKNARVVGCRKRRPPHTRARPVDRVRSPRRHRDGRRSRDDRAGLTRSLRRARSPSRALRATDVRRAFRAMAREAHPTRGATTRDSTPSRPRTTPRSPSSPRHFVRLTGTIGATAEPRSTAEPRRVGGAAFDARRADAPGRRAVARRHRRRHRRRRRRRRARTPPLDPTSTLPRPRSPPRGARASPPARARALGPPSRRAIVSLAVNARGFRRRRPRRRRRRVARPVRQTRRRVPIRRRERTRGEPKKKPRDARGRRTWWIGGGGDDDENVDGDDALLAAAEDGPRASSPRTGRTAPRTGRTALEPGPISSARPLSPAATSRGSPPRVGRRRTAARRPPCAPLRWTRRRERGDSNAETPADFGSFGSFHLGATPVATPVATLRGHEAGLTCACVSGATLATCDARGEFRLWRLPNGDPTTTVRWGSDGTPSSGARSFPETKNLPEALDRDREPLRLATAHYSRGRPRSRFVWRIGDGDDPVARVRGYEAEIPEAVEPSRKNRRRARAREATNET